MTRAADGNATNSVGEAQGTSHWYGVQGDGGSIDTCLIYMALLLIVQHLEQSLVRQRWWLVESRTGMRSFGSVFDFSATIKVKLCRAY